MYRTEAQEILSKLTHLKNLYGGGARQYVNDPIRAKHFLLEIHEQIRNAPGDSVRTFGMDVCEEITVYWLSCYN